MIPEHTTPDHLFETLMAESRTFIDEVFTGFSNFHRSQVGITHDALSDVCNILRTDGLSANVSRSAILNRLEKAVSLLSSDTGPGRYPEKYLQFPEIRKTWEKTLTEGLSDSIRIPWPESVFTTDHQDSFLFSLYKKHRKRIRNRSLKKASEKARISEWSHTVHEQRFVRTFFTAPATPLFISFADTLFSNVFSDITRYHETIRRLTYQLLNICLQEEPDDADGETIGSEQHKETPPEQPSTCNVSETAEQLMRFPETTMTAIESVRSDFIESFTDTMNACKEQFIRNYHKAGTLFYPSFRYSESRLLRIQKKHQKNDAGHHKLWTASFSGETEDFNHDLCLAGLQLKLTRTTLQSAEMISQKTESQVLPMCSQAYETLKTVHDRLAALKKEPERVSRTKLFNDSRLLLNEFRGNRLPSMITKVLHSGISRDLSLLIESTVSGLSMVSDNHRIVKTRSRQIPPELVMVDVPIRDIIETTLLEPFKKDVQSFQQSLAIKLNESVNAISEILQMVEFNIDASNDTEDGDKAMDDRLQIITEGISRSMHRLEPIISTLEGIPAEAAESLDRIAENWVAGINNLMDSTVILNMKLSLAKARATARILSFKTKSTDTMLKSGGRIVSLWGRLLRRCQEIVTGVRTRLGLSLPEEHHTVQFRQFLLETHRKIESLPFTYQQLFKNEPLTDPRLFLGRNSEMEQLLAAVDLFKKENRTTVAVIGENGSGRTTLINMFCNKTEGKFDVKSADVSETFHEEGSFVNALCRQLELPEQNSFAELEAYLGTLDRPTLIILENIQKLFLRCMGGFELLETFLSFMQRTNAPVFWLCSCTWYSWGYLDRLMEISGRFQTVVSLKPFSGSQTEEVIMRRNRLTGYTLRFQAHPDILGKRGYRKLKSEDSRQQYLQSLFFEQIDSIAAGNISVAILFWMIAIKHLNEYDLHLSAKVDFNASVLTGLNQDHLFTLCAVVRHSSLDCQDHMKIFRLPEDRSKMMLNYLTETGALQSINGQYRIHPFLYRHVIRLLKRHNLLH